MSHRFRAGTRVTAAALLPACLWALAFLLASGCAHVPPRPAPGYERMRDTLERVDAAGLAGRRIALDPGHGGFFRGALGVHGLSEAEVNLGVALRLRDLLAAHGAAVLLTREGDRDFLTPADSTLRSDLAERSRLANAFRPDLFLSIHHNADPGGAHDVNATATYYKLGDEGPSLEAAQDVHRALVRNLGIAANKVVPGNYAVLRASEAPALLTESSYLTDPDVEARLRLPEKQELEAEALFVGLARYFARRVPAIEDFAATDAAAAGGLPLGSAWPVLRARVSGAWDRAWLTVDGVPQEPLRLGDRLEWRPAEALGRGPHHAVLRVALSGEGSSRARRLDFGVAVPLDRILAAFPDQPIWDGRQPLGLEITALDAGGSPYPDSLPVRVRTSGNVALLPADTVVTLAGGSGWAYFREGRVLARTPGGGRRPKAAPALGSLDVEVAEEPPTPVEDVPAAQVRDHETIPVGDEPVSPVRTGFALRMPEGFALRGAPGTAGPAPALAWINRDGFVRLRRDSAGAVRVPSLAGYRSWPSDSAFPPRFTAIAGGALLGRRIVLDPEGGGDDAAGQGPGGTRASFLNLECARILAGFLSAAGAQVRLTRDGDLALSDVERVQVAEGFAAERFLRIAHRAAAPRLGTYWSSAAGHRWAESQARALAALGLPAPPVADDAAYVVTQTSCPSLAASLARVDEAREESRLDGPGTLRAEAYALFLALAREWAPGAEWPLDSLEVRDAAGAPVPGAAVTLGGALVLETDALGRTRFARTEPGPIEAWVEESRARVRRVLLDSERGTVLTGTTGR